MKVTTKGRYALRAIIALAELEKIKRPVTIKTIAEKEDISADFLEQIFFKLRKAGVVASVRGPGGGFQFNRDLKDISLKEIIIASGESLNMTECTCGKKSDCNKRHECTAYAVWDSIYAKFDDYFSTISLADVIEKKGKVAKPIL